MPQIVSHTIQEFINYLTYQKRCSKHTIISYRADLAAFFSYSLAEFETVSIQEVSPVIIRSWLASLKESGLTASTINRKISSLNSFFKYHLRQHTINQNPTATISALKKSRKLPVFLEERDTGSLFEAGFFTNTWEGQLHQLIFAILYHTGIRLSELIHLKEPHVDKSNSVIKVLGKRNKERLIPVNNQLLHLIDLYLAEKKKTFPELPHPYLLVNKKGKMLYPKYVYNMVKENLAKITTLKRKSPHILRHSFATHLINKGAPINAIKELLGHTSLAATQIYTHNSIEKLKEVHHQAHPKA